MIGLAHEFIACLRFALYSLHAKAKIPFKLDVLMTQVKPLYVVGKSDCTFSSERLNQV